MGAGFDPVGDSPTAYAAGGATAAEGASVDSMEKGKTLEYKISVEQRANSAHNLQQAQAENDEAMAALSKQDQRRYKSMVDQQRDFYHKAAELDREIEAEQKGKLDNYSARSERSKRLCDLASKVGMDPINFQLNRLKRTGEKVNASLDYFVQTFSDKLYSTRGKNKGYAVQHTELHIEARKIGRAMASTRKALKSLDDEIGRVQTDINTLNESPRAGYSDVQREVKDLYGELNRLMHDKQARERNRQTVKSKSSQVKRQIEQTGKFKMLYERSLTAVQFQQQQVQGEVERFEEIVKDRNKDVAGLTKAAGLIQQGEFVARRMREVTNKVAEYQMLELDQIEEQQRGQKSVPNEDPYRNLAETQSKAKENMQLEEDSFLQEFYPQGLEE